MAWKTAHSFLKSMAYFVLTNVRYYKLRITKSLCIYLSQIFHKLQFKLLLDLTDLTAYLFHDLDDLTLD